MKSLPHFLMNLAVIGLIFLTACGRRTPPHPIKTDSAFKQLKVAQRGNQLRLSWVMEQSIVAAAETQRFHIEELELDPLCTNCPPQLTKVYLAPFPSDHFIISGKHVFFYPITRKDLKVHIYKVIYQTEDGNNLSNPQVAHFTGFSDYPSPSSLRWDLLPQGALPKLPKIPIATIPSSAKEARLLRLSWELEQEKVEFYFPNQNELAQRKLFYRVNLYKKKQGDPWPELPLNEKPIAENFYIDYQLPSEQAFLYQMRWVDSEGNESGPSATYPVSLKPKT